MEVTTLMQMKPLRKKKKKTKVLNIETKL